MNKPVMLLIMDGFGLAAPGPKNAISMANTPNLDMLFASCPNSKLYASGKSVGLPDGQMGNSEVGHTNMGAGRVVWQELSKITNEIENGEFFENPVLCEIMDNIATKGSALHLMGLLSDGGVHSHNTHLYALIKMAKQRGIKNLYIHCIMDGRDVPPACGEKYLAELEEKCNEIGLGKIASVCGRFYAMDRDKRWDRVEAAYNLYTLGEGKKADTWQKLMKMARADGENDEFIKPCFVDSDNMINFDAKCGLNNFVSEANNKFNDVANIADKNDSNSESNDNILYGFANNGIVNDGDGIIFFNFRPDRAREITRCFVDSEFDGFERKKIVNDLSYVCFTQYDATMPNVNVAFPPQSLKNTLGEYVSSLGKTQLRIAETEKYAHVTFFFNGGIEEPYPGEDRILVASPKVATYDLKPEMSAYEVTDRVVERINNQQEDLIIMNLANCDMVGHTGVFDAAVKAVEAVDTCVGRIVDAIKNAGGLLLITADHGNADEMLDEAGNIVTSHSTNPVPLIYYNPNTSVDNASVTGDSASCVNKNTSIASDNAHSANSDFFNSYISLCDGALCDLAPTLLEMMGLPVPPEMEGKSLIVNKKY